MFCYYFQGSFIDIKIISFESEVNRIETRDRDSQKNQFLKTCSSVF